ncbi:MAG: Uma2 family endonuclease [bacterium]|nr:Uma2 family endonuclease [bacterium]
MLDATKPVTIDEFWAFVNLPENEDRRWELINGEIVEMPPSDKINSFIASLINHFLMTYILANKSGYMTTADGGYRIGRSVLQPDVGYISKARSGGLKGNFYENAPDLAVEVVSVKSEKEEDAFRKAHRYLSNGTRMVWVVYPDDKTVYVCLPKVDGGMTVDVFDTTMTLSGGDVLPNFSLPVADIFPEDEE